MDSRKFQRKKRKTEREGEERRKRGLLHGGPPYTDATRASKYKGARGSDAPLRLCASISRRISSLRPCAMLRLVAFANEAAKFSSPCL